jgi:hypothetical protein
MAGNFPVCGGRNTEAGLGWGGTPGAANRMFHPLSVPNENHKTELHLTQSGNVDTIQNSGCDSLYF